MASYIVWVYADLIRKGVIESIERVPEGIRDEVAALVGADGNQAAEGA